MKCIKPSVEIIPIPSPDNEMSVYKHLELIGRTCYKSEDKITNDSCVKFIGNLFKNRHWAVLEHYPFVVLDNNYTLTHALEDLFHYEFPDIQNALRFVFHNTINQFADPETSEEVFKKVHLVSGSATSFNYLYKAIVDHADSIDSYAFKVYSSFMDSMHIRFPMLFMEPGKYKVYDSGGVQYYWKLLSQDELGNDDNLSIHKYMTVRFICDRGISHEIVRHRCSSFAQESSRYCNYRGSGCEFIIPNWFSKEAVEFVSKGDIEADSKKITNPEWQWYMSMISADTAYDDMISSGWTPQQARSILPTSLKTELVMTANLQEWAHFFAMRVPTSAHPQIRELAIPLYYQAREMFGAKWFPDLEDAIPIRERLKYSHDVSR